MMARRDVRAQGLAETILSFLRQRGEDASSHMLAGHFLKLSVNSEEIATRLLRPVLEPMGALYRDGEGWVAGIVSSETGPARQPVFAAVFDADAGLVHIVPTQGEQALPPLPSGAAIPADAMLVMLEPQLHAGA